MVGDDRGRRAVVERGGGQPALRREAVSDLRSDFLSSYEMVRAMYSMRTPGRRFYLPCQAAAEIGFYVAMCDIDGLAHSRKPRIPMKDLKQFAADWKDLIVRVSTAHDKDAADRAEADVEKCLTPV